MAATARQTVADQATKTAAPGGGTIPFDLSQPPFIEGFSPLPRTKDETFKGRFSRKVKENPFVPIGCFVTAGILMWGLRSFVQGNSRKSQLLMRSRVIAQGLTVTAFVLSVAAASLKTKE
ncbi:HIG1 domain family member 2A, mitochondrial [Festucalex cinctus]